MKTLRNAFLNVIGISVDNAAVNRKVFLDLCDGNLKTHIIDPTTGQPIYLFFDPVHGIKNIYNNFQKRKVFHCPSLARKFYAVILT